MCIQYLCEENAAVFDEVREQDLYITSSNIIKTIEEDYEYYPRDDKIIVDTEALFKRYFKSTEGRNRQWRVLQEFPKLSPNHDTIYIECWFYKSNFILKVDFLKFATFCSDKFIMVAFTAFLQLNINDVEYFNKNKDATLRKYARIAGFTPVRLTRS